MNRVNKQSGFSLIELLLVVVVIGIVAAVAVPAYQKSRRAAENGSTFATLRVISSTQMTYFSQNNRFATLPQLQAMQNNALGTTVVDKIFRGTYVFELSNPTDPADLAREFTVTATRALPGEPLRVYELDQTGTITQVLPAGAPAN